MGATLVTGGTGFLGRHLVRRLVDRGDNVRVMCRGSRDGREEVAIVRGDIASRSDVLRAMEGATQVYHLAGFVSRDPRHAAALYRTHLEGTRNICEAALAGGVGKIVLVSSSGTVAVSRRPVFHDEGSGYKPDVLGELPYFLSKLYAEKMAMDYWRRTGLPVVIVQPSLLLGPGDLGNSSTGDVALFLARKLPSIPSGGLNLVDVRDVANGLIAAMERGRPGERYLLGGPNWTFRRFGQELERISGVPSPKMALPTQVAVAGGRFLRRLYPLIKQEFPLDETTIRMAGLYWYFSSARASSELGFAPRDPSDTLRDTIEWLRGAPRAAAL